MVFCPIARELECVNDFETPVATRRATGGRCARGAFPNPLADALAVLHNVLSRLWRVPRLLSECVIGDIKSYPQSVLSGANVVIIKRKSLFATLAFALPIAALVASPAMAAKPHKAKAHTHAVHKASTHKAPAKHKAKAAHAAVR